MKKRVGKLALSKETLHSLDLAAVAAGATRFCTAMICPQSAVGGTCEGTCNASCIET
jgi:hypothetical protein